MTRTLPFLFSEHEATCDELAQVKVIVARQRAQFDKIKQDLEGCNWIIKEKDTEMKFINKEKEELLQKMLEARLEIVQQKQTIKQLQDGMERLVAEVQRGNP